MLLEISLCLPHSGRVSGYGKLWDTVSEVGKGSLWSSGTAELTKTFPNGATNWALCVQTPKPVGGAGSEEVI